MNADPIQTQRETWLRARIARAEREKEYEAGVSRLLDSVERARAREAEEEASLDRLILGAKASFDAYKELPHGMQEVSAEEAQAVEHGAVFAIETSEAGGDQFDAGIKAPDKEGARAGPPTERAGFEAFSEAAP